jgi:hypothetical protein
MGKAGRTKKGRRKRKKNEKGRSRPATKRESWERDGQNEAREREAEKKTHRAASRGSFRVGRGSGRDPQPPSMAHPLWRRHSPALG